MSGDRDHPGVGPIPRVWRLRSGYRRTSRGDPSDRPLARKKLTKMSTGNATSPMLYVAASAIADRQREARNRSQVATAKRTRRLAR